jgi:hypothetical protein
MTFVQNICTYNVDEIDTLSPIATCGDKLNFSNIVCFSENHICYPEIKRLNSIIEKYLGQFNKIRGDLWSKNVCHYMHFLFFPMWRQWHLCRHICGDSCYYVGHHCSREYLYCVCFLLSPYPHEPWRLVGRELYFHIQNWLFIKFYFIAPTDHPLRNSIYGRK